MKLRGKTKKEKTQSFEGVIIAKHNKKNQIGSTITVRKMFQGGGIEKVFILNSPGLKKLNLFREQKLNVQSYIILEVELVNRRD